MLDYSPADAPDWPRHWEKEPWQKPSDVYPTMMWGDMWPTVSVGCAVLY